MSTAHWALQTAHTLLPALWNEGLPATAQGQLPPPSAVLVTRHLFCWLDACAAAWPAEANSKPTAGSLDNASSRFAPSTGKELATDILRLWQRLPSSLQAAAAAPLLALLLAALRPTALGLSRWRIHSRGNLFAGEHLLTSPLLGCTQLMWQYLAGELLLRVLDEIPFTSSLVSVNGDIGEKSYAGLCDMSELRSHDSFDGASPKDSCCSSMLTPSKTEGKCMSQPATQLAILLVMDMIGNRADMPALTLTGLQRWKTGACGRAAQIFAEQESHSRDLLSGWPGLLRNLDQPSQ